MFTIYCLKSLGNSSRKLGFDIEQAEFKVSLHPNTHLEQVHGRGWNRTWREFFEKFEKTNKEPSEAEVRKQLENMRKNWGI